jgi:hypothetical protein
MTQGTAEADTCGQLSIICKLDCGDVRQTSDRVINWATLVLMQLVRPLVQA